MMANPVAAGLVQHARQWPGVKTLPADVGSATWTASRPEFFFDASNPDWPPHATLQLVAPPSAGRTIAQVRALVDAELSHLERDAHAEVKRKGWRFLGAHKMASLSPLARARSWEPLRARNPTFAVGRDNPQAFFDCAARLRSFRERYREALAAWRQALRDVVFPAGTWWMNVFHAAPVALE